MSSPWRVMRLMGQCYGYAAATMPMIGQVKTELKEGSRWGPKTMKRGPRN